MEVIFYEKPCCATNARQRRLLEAASHSVLARNLLSEPWTEERLSEFFARLPVPQWFNSAAPRIKSGALDPATLTPEAALALLRAEPLLIKRPLIEIGNARIAGFDEQRSIRRAAPSAVCRRHNKAGSVCRKKNIEP
jgi:nitrogenase-associated protein